MRPKPSKPARLPADRRSDAILKLLRGRGSCTIEELAGRLGVSDMTVRRDLRALGEAGRVVRTHGGAAIGERVAFEFGFLQRMRERREAKRAIAEAAFRRLDGAKSVLLDSGTTTLALADLLQSAKKLTVITTSLPVASSLQFAAGVDLLLLGGLLRRESPDLGGPLTETNLEGLRADVAFLGADAVDRNGVVFNESQAVARMLGKMAEAAGRVYCVADSSKLGKTALARFAHARNFTGLITDDDAPPPIRRSLKNAGVHLILAPVKRSRNSRLPT